MIPASNWTTSEMLRYHGTLPDDRLDELVELESSLETIDVRPYLREALGGLPNEDFLQPIIKRLQFVVSQMRDTENRQELKRIIADATELQMQVYRDSCHTEEQIDLAHKTINTVLRGE